MEAREGNLYTHPRRRGGGWEEILVSGGRSAEGREERHEGGKEEREKCADSVARREEGAKSVGLC